MKADLLVVSGGPGGGKTEFLKVVPTEFGELVEIAKEQASATLDTFPRPGQDIELTEELNWFLQKGLYPTQLAREEWTREFATKKGAKLVICDRGLLDGAAYVPGGLSVYEQILGINASEVLTRYRAVILFESLATADPELWEKIKGSNPARYETLEQAIEREHAVREVWQGHPNLYLIGGSDLAYKISRGLEIISSYLDSEHELKFLLPAMPDIPLPIGARIEQGYLFDDPQAEMRIRIKDEVGYLGLKGENQSGSRVSRYQKEMKLFGTPLEKFWEMTRGKRIMKVRFEIPYGDFVIELDQFYGEHDGLVILEVEANRPEQLEGFKLPEWAKKAINVTEDSRFSNRELARTQKIPKPAA